VVVAGAGSFAGRLLRGLSRRLFATKGAGKSAQTPVAGNKPNTSVFTDSVNNLRVITHSETGWFITVIPGGG